MLATACGKEKKKKKKKKRIGVFVFFVFFFEEHKFFYSFVVLMSVWTVWLGRRMTHRCQQCKAFSSQCALTCAGDPSGGFFFEKTHNQKRERERRERERETSKCLFRTLP